MTATSSERKARRESRLAELRARRRQPARIPVVPIVVAALGVLVVSYIGLTFFQSQSRAPVAQVAPSSPQPGEFARPVSPPAPGNPAPDFTVQTLDHGAFTLSNQRPKPTVAFFTASYCEPCIPQMRALARVQEEVGADKLSVVVLDVDPTETLEDLRRLQRRIGASYPFALDTGNRVTLDYGVRALDTKMYVDRNGALVDRVDGIPESNGQLRNRVAGLLKER